MAKVKQSPFKFLPFVLVGLVIVGGVGFIISKVLGGGSKTTPATTTPPPVKQTKQITLTYWGLWETNDVLEEVLTDFEQANSGVTINYVKQSHRDYRERLQTAVASGNGPDLFRFHASWVPMLQNELAPMPSSVMTANEYQQTFYPVATEQLQLNGQIVGVPLMYDGLGLYYNTEILKSANAQPPRTWAELKSLASKLTVRNGGEIERGGVALGNASNVEHFADIVGLLMLQNGADPTQPESNEVRDALLFYTNFVKSDRVWSDKLPSSTVAFARGDVAMMLAPSWRAHEVMIINPSLDFGIAPAPMLGDDQLTWASYWAEGVSAQSENTDMAWQLIKYLSSSEVEQKLYSDQSQDRAFGEIYSRTDLADQLAGDQLVSAFLEDAPYAEGWYLSSYTHDNGINDQLIKYYQDAINAMINDGLQVDKVLPTVSQGTKQVLRQYGLSSN